MTDMVMSTKTLPDLLLRLIHSERVRVREEDGEFRVTPIVESAESCPFLGLYSDGKLTVDKHLEWKHEDKELER